MFCSTMQAFSVRPAPLKMSVTSSGSKAVEPTLDLDHVARAVIHMASLPLEANIQFMTIMATTMPFIGRG
jgi:NADP-dependent 3-hydroxy acid dehydrogenase YdfG